MSELEINISSDYDEVVKVNNAVNDFLSKEGIEELIRNAFDICLTEALNNVIKHAYKEEKGKSIQVRIIKDKNFIEVNIIDEGMPRTNLEIKKLDYDPEDLDSLPESGMGLFIIQQLMDELDYFSINGKNYFILKKWLY
ncbi:ATP-binding protein [Ignavibacteria bacterium 4148-Me]|uniref:ATP-binding protein n=1 Tax=Rosettibacter primus TaxID=3111523 RepID=UPI00336BF593